jgi:thioredoxin-related protein
MPDLTQSALHKIGRKLPCLMLLLLIPLRAGLASEGAYYGAIPSEKPDWFKESFLEFEEDVAEAAAAGRRVMLYFHQDRCPYCARLVEENFADPELKAFIIENFDGITINMWGDREFLDENGQVALRLNGYYPPQDFRAALEYVARKLENKLSFAQYRLDAIAASSGQLIGEDFFLDQLDMQKIIDASDSPLAVYFEAPDCAECATMHSRILSDEATRKLVRQADNVQLNVASSQQVTTPAGEQKTVAQWARELGIAYTPSVVFFDDSGKEVMRISAFLKTFHFQSVYAYVLDKAYLEEPEFQRYISARADHIREAGFDTDIWGYDSFHD